MATKTKNVPQRPPRTPRADCDDPTHASVAALAMPASEPPNTRIGKVALRHLARNRWNPRAVFDGH